MTDLEKDFPEGNPKNKIEDIDDVPDTLDSVKVTVKRRQDEGSNLSSLLEKPEEIRGENDEHNKEDSNFPSKKL